MFAYYTSHFLIGRDPDETRKGWRIPAPAFEATISSAVDRFLQNQTALADAWREANLPFEQFGTVIGIVRSALTSEPLQLIERVELTVTGLALTVSLATLVSDGPTLTHHVPITVRRRGVEMRMVIDNETRNLDPILLSAIARGHKWFGELARGDAANMVEIAARDSVSAGRVNQLTRLAFLSPKIVQAIIDGRHPVDLTTKTFARLENLPVAWAEQEALLGF